MQQGKVHGHSDFTRMSSSSGAGEENPDVRLADSVAVGITASKAVEVAEGLATV